MRSFMVLFWCLAVSEVVGGVESVVEFDMTEYLRRKCLELSCDPEQFVVEEERTEETVWIKARDGNLRLTAFYHENEYHTVLGSGSQSREWVEPKQWALLLDHAERDAEVEVRSEKHAQLQSSTSEKYMYPYSSEYVKNTAVSQINNANLPQYLGWYKDHASSSFKEYLNNNGDKVPFDAIFISWVFANHAECAGLPNAYTRRIYEEAEEVGATFPTKWARMGDVAIIDCSGNGAESPDHVGIVESVNTTDITCIEVDNSKRTVIRNVHSRNSVVCVIRPYYPPKISFNACGHAIARLDLLRIRVNPSFEDEDILMFINTSHTVTEKLEIDGCIQGPWVRVRYNWTTPRVGWISGGEHGNYAVLNITTNKVNVITDGLRVRTSTDTSDDDNIIDTLYPGHVLEYMGKQSGAWFKVLYGVYVGWSHRDYLMLSTHMEDTSHFL